MRLHRCVVALVVPFVAAALLPRPAASAAIPRDAQVRVRIEPLSEFGFAGATDSGTGGTDIDFSGRYVYAMQRGNFGGVHIFDVSGRKPVKVSFVACPGNQNDVAVVRPGLIALGYHSSGCRGVDGGGIRLIDVSDPRRARLLGALALPPGGTHTLTAYPGEPLVYSNTSTGQAIVDVSDPRHPKVVWRLDRDGCHDLLFDLRPDRKLAFCPMGSGALTQVWDVADPRSPRVISSIVNPAILYHHSAAVTSDGRHLVIGDEAVGTCAGAPTGALWIYDISDPATPKLVSAWAPSHRGVQGGLDLSRGCGTVHNYNMIPGTDILVAAWMEGGVNVLDLSDPSAPAELAWYDEADTTYWSAYYYRGRIYATDWARGLDVFRLDGVGRSSR